MNRNKIPVSDSSLPPDLQRIMLELLHDDLSRYLAIICRWMQILLNEEEGPLNEKQKVYLTHVQNMGREAKETLDSFMTFLTQELELEVLDLSKCIDEAVERVRTQIEGKNQTLTLQLSTVPQIQANKERLVQVLVELLFNACKYTPIQGKITLTAERLDKFVKVSITDTGVGIAPEDKKWIFGRFNHANDSVGQDQNAIVCGGLGLAISKAIIEYFGGEIDFESELGKGSIFWFTVPCVQAQRTG